MAAVVGKLQEREEAARRVAELDAELQALRTTAEDRGADEEEYMLAIIGKLQEQEAAGLRIKALDAELAQHPLAGAGQ